MLKPGTTVTVEETKTTTEPEPEPPKGCLGRGLLADFCLRGLGAAVYDAQAALRTNFGHTSLSGQDEH